MSKEVAELLDITPATVKIFKANIMKKMGVDNIADLVQISITNQLQSEPKT